jgi:hypothetical protein
MRKHIITPQEITEVFAHVAVGSTFADEASRMRVTPHRLIAAARQQDASRVNDLIHAQHVRNGRRSGLGRHTTAKVQTSGRVEPPAVVPPKSHRRHTDTHTLFHRSHHGKPTRQPAVLDTVPHGVTRRGVAAFSADELAALQAKIEQLVQNGQDQSYGPYVPRGWIERD